jgi:uroporphyrinogen-III decarboxylase
MHRGCIPFIGRRDFREIYWATLRPIIEELWSNGQQIIFYAEGNWDEHLEAFAKLPEKSIIFHADKTDIFKAHRVLGDKFAISGGIPIELLTNGTPDQVRSCCKRVIDEVGRDGGYIMDASALIMNDAKVENVKAMVDFTLDYGVYSQGASGSSLGELKSIYRPAAKGVPALE